MSDQDALLLQPLVARLRSAPEFMASVLHEFSSSEHLTEHDLMQRLGTTSAGVLRLALCKAPDVAAADGRAQIETVAAHAGVNAFALAQIVRAVDATRAFLSRPDHETEQHADEHGLLAAARDVEQPATPASLPASSRNSDTEE
jgi:hypothetical protein